MGILPMRRRAIPDRGPLGLALIRARRGGNLLPTEIMADRSGGQRVAHPTILRLLEAQEHAGNVVTFLQQQPRRHS